MAKKTTNSGTRVYGSSDDHIIFDGDVYGQVDCYGSDESDDAVILFFSDATVLKVWYGKPIDGGIWAVEVVRKGSLLKAVEICTDSDADPYSDVAVFEPGLKWAFEARKGAQVA